jgi:hypothetical protein
MRDPPDLDEVGEPVKGVWIFGSKGIQLSLSLSIGGVAGVTSVFGWAQPEYSLVNEVSTCGTTFGGSIAVVELTVGWYLSCVVVLLAGNRFSGASSSGKLTSSGTSPL